MTCSLSAVAEPVRDVPAFCGGRDRSRRHRKDREMQGLSVMRKIPNIPSLLPAFPNSYRICEFYLQKAFLKSYTGISITRTAARMSAVSYHPAAVLKDQTRRRLK